MKKNYPLLKDKTYLMSASIGAIHQDVHQAQIDFVNLLTNRGACDEGMLMNLMDEALQVLANFLAVAKEDVALGPSVSHFMNVMALMLKENFPQNIISIEEEFPATVIPWDHHGYEVRTVAFDHGELPLEKLLRLIDKKTTAVVVSSVQFLSGHRIDLEVLGEALHQLKIPFIVNATQQLGAFPLSIQSAKISALVCSPHKWLCAGMGSSLFFLDQTLRKQKKWPLAGWCSVENVWDLQNSKPQLRKDLGVLMIGTQPFVSVAAVKAAIEVYQKLGAKDVAQKIENVAFYFWKQLQTLPVQLMSHHHMEKLPSGIFNFCLRDSKKSLNEVIENLRAQEIFVNIRKGSIRASVHHYNDQNDVDHLVNVLKEVI